MSLELSLIIVVVFTLVGIISGVPIGYIFGIACIILMFTSGNIDWINRLVPSSLKMMQGWAFLALPLYIMVGSVTVTVRETKG